MRWNEPEVTGSERQRFTLVAFHAHPDDEALLTGGTLARAAAEGHRVVLVTATSGERGLAGPGDGHGSQLGRIRATELAEAAAALGCSRLVSLGYGDSGLRPEPGDLDAFANADVQAAAGLLAEVLREERADVLTIYDRNGGYGHPDHVQVHRVGASAARLAGTPVVLEATVSAGLFRSALLVTRAFGHRPPLGTRRVFSDRREITHRIQVRDALPAKRAALLAHRSQRRAEERRRRVLDHILRLPPSVFALVFGHEWFIEHGRDPAGRETDVFASLRRGEP
jgi:LmbE family N-acetylglucosaminyl deacetylase